MVKINSWIGKRVINVMLVPLLAVLLSLLSNATVFADVPTPTLDRVKAEQSTFLNTNYSTYSLTEVKLDTTVPDGAITVNIGDKKYYYTPTDNKDVLQLLSSTGNVALIETTQEKALYTTPDGKYYTYDSSKLKDSAYTLIEATSADEPNTITLYDKNADGTVTPKYYTVSLKQTEYGNPNGDKALKFGWEKNADKGNLEFKQDPATPVGQIITYKYSESDFSKTEAHSLDKGTIENPSGTSSNHSIIDGGAALNNPSGSISSIDNVLFKDNLTTATVISNIRDYRYVDVYGGAIYNAGTLSNVVGCFVDNGLDLSISVSNSSANSMVYINAYGGALANKGEIENITADFINNYVKSNAKTNSSISSIFAFAGGAIYNSGTIGQINANFVGNKIQVVSPVDGYGGAIYNSGTIGNITGDFIGNYAQGSDTKGGAIYNDGSNATIESITGDFIANYVKGSSYAYGGAIYNNGYSSIATIGDITGDFIGNYVLSKGSAHGGAIYNSESIGNITGDFIGNYVQSDSHYAYGGAIYNSHGTVADISGDFVANHILGDYAYGGAIYNYAYNSTATIKSIVGNFIGNYAQSNSYEAYGGAIYNYRGTIGNITGDFIGNYAQSNSYEAYGGAIYNSGIIENITGDFIGNYSHSNSSSKYANGGAIYNSGTITLKDSSFINNGVISPKDANGGAIYINYGTVNIIAENKDVVFDGNYSATAKNPDGTLENICV